jgi:hypothetical protein
MYGTDTSEPHSHEAHLFDWQESLSGVDGVRIALNTVLTELHKVLYKQLLAWLLQGNLYDPYQVGP